MPWPSPSTFFCAVFHLKQPGIYCDELFFGNAALGGLDDSFIYTRLGPLPTYLVYYLGALKAWVYWPIFKWFGVSVYSIRLPVILLTVVGLWLYYAFALRFTNRRVAGAAVVLLAANTTFVWGTKLDFSPLVMEFLFQTSAAWLLLAGGNPWLLGALLTIALFNKATFLWWAFGAFLSAVVLLPERRLLLAKASLLPGAYLGGWAWLFHRDLQAENSPLLFADRLAATEKQFSALLDGTAFYAHTYGPLPQNWWPAVLVVGTLVAGIGAGAKAWARSASPPGSTNRLYSFLLLQIAGSLALIFCTPRAISYWHFFPLLPWLVLAFCLALHRLPRPFLALGAL